jgi:hypothetical protein
MAAARVNPRKSSASRTFSFHRASNVTTTAATTRAATSERRATWLTERVSPASGKRKPAGNQSFRGERRRVLPDSREKICLEGRRHGIVLARPLAWSVVLAGAGGAIATLPSPWLLIGMAIVALAAAIALRAVWKWERTRVVVTTEKVFVVSGTWRRHTRAVRLAAVEMVELEQSLAGQLLGYGTVVVGSLALDHVPRPKRLYRLVERLSAKPTATGFVRV